MGLRLRWLGTDRLTYRDLWAMVYSFAQDENSNLFRSVKPEHVPTPVQVARQATRLASDQVNALALIQSTIRALAGERIGKFTPIYSYPGSPFDPEKKSSSMFAAGSKLGGYKLMKKGEAMAWAKAKGLPV